MMDPELREDGHASPCSPHTVRFVETMVRLQKRKCKGKDRKQINFIIK